MPYQTGISDAHAVPNAARVRAQLPADHMTRPLSHDARSAATTLSVR
jgi:hypothetical protein